MEFSNFFLLFGAAILSGAMNSIAGGGGFIVFPALIFTGVPPISANATNNTVGLVGFLGSLSAYRKEYASHRRELLILCGISSIGALLGSLVLLNTSQIVFTKLIPYLMLLATLLFTFNKLFISGLANCSQLLFNSSHFPKWTMRLLQLAIFIYGGFFGAGMGIMILGMLTAMNVNNIHTMNAYRTAISVCINGVCMISFILAGVIWWPQALLMSVGTLVSSYVIAHYALRINPLLVRRFASFIGFSLTLYFFIRT